MTILAFFGLNPTYYQTWSKISLDLKLMLTMSLSKQIKVTASVLIQD
jgi:hypothetical protein